MTKKIRITFYDGATIGGWTCTVCVDGQTYPVNRYVGDGHGGAMPCAFDNKEQARKAAVAEARRIVRA